MIFFDVTKASQSDHRSGLQRVSARLREELGPKAVSVVWDKGWREFASSRAIVFSAQDWLLTPELFSELERPGFWRFLDEKSVRLAAIFHDAIPLKFPQFTWPRSVARHPEYLKMLRRFDRVFAVSDASKQELTGFWKWQGEFSSDGTSSAEQVQRIELGADFSLHSAREKTEAVSSEALPPRLLCVGILEPRKNQELLIDVAEQLFAEGLRFRLDFVGRANPHFGKNLELRLRRTTSLYPSVKYWGPASDERMQELWSDARATIFPTLAEGCGLPLLESIGRGVPCICSDLPVLRENGEGGGCLFVATNDRAAWKDALEKVIRDDAFTQILREQAGARVMPTWSQAAAQLLATLHPI